MPAITPHDGPVAVTGCSGFTGGHMVRELAIHGYDVRACIRDASSWRGKDCVQYLNAPCRTGRPSSTAATSSHQGSYDDAFKGLCRRLPCRRRARQLGRWQVAAAWAAGDVSHGCVQRRHRRHAERHRCRERERERQAHGVHELHGRSLRGEPGRHRAPRLRVDGNRLVFGRRANRSAGNTRATAYARSKVDTERLINRRRRCLGRRPMGRHHHEPSDDLRADPLQGAGRPVDRADRSSRRRAWSRTGRPATTCTTTSSTCATW